MEGAYSGFAKLYDSLMNDVDYDAWTTYLVNLVERYLPQTSVPVAADVACGTGEITIRLANRGWQMLGVDLSADMLGIAQQKARLSGLTTPFIQQDMRALALHKPVDVLTACCDGVNYLTSIADVSAFFAAAHKALKPDGLLLFDISSEYKLTGILDGQTFGEVRENEAYIWQNCFDPESRLIEMSLTFFCREGQCYRRFDETHIQRAHSISEIDALLRQNGFDIFGCYAAFTDTAPTDDTERIQWIARRSL